MSLKRKGCIAVLALIVVGAIGIWVMLPKEVELEATTLGELLDETNCSDSLGPFLSKFGVEDNAPLIDPPIRKKQWGRDSILALFPDCLLRYSEDGVLQSAILMSTMYSSNPSPPEGPLTRERFREKIEELLEFDIWNSKDVEGLTYEVVVRATVDENGNEYVPRFFKATATNMYKGIHCSSGAYFEADTRTGTIYDIRNIPFVEPESLEENITREEAITIASKFAGRKGVSTGDYEAKQTIIHPSNFWSIAKMAMPVFSPDTRLCWNIRFKQPGSDSLGHDVFVIVDCGTGKIVGGLDLGRGPTPPPDEEPPIYPEPDAPIEN